ncbi:MAG: protein kinase [Gemmataceae bacterium]
MTERSVFLEALEIPAPAERAAFLDRACGGDPRLRAAVEGLLAAEARPGSFMRRPAAGDGTADLRPAEGPGARVGPYKLLQEIGEGGMGVVYMAEQEEPVRRKVALKIIKPGMDSKQVVARFEAERQALGMMDHPNIAKVFDAGATDGGRPYFVMELVHGVPITEYCDVNRLTPHERLGLFVPVCQAIQHAHQKGIIHRDIKPSNVLVTMYDDKPVPKVIDFGVAKAVEQRLTERTLFTQFGTLVGTFEYMSPEQAEMNAFGVDTRSDVYSLGVLLYELLTGTTPLERQRLRTAAFGEVVRLIKEEEPPRPSLRISTSGALAKVAAARKTEPGRLSTLVRGELDWIVMRCLEKDRTRRYDTAVGLAKDVERFLRDEPVEACPPTLGYRVRKAVRRYKAQVAVAAVLGLALVGGIVGTTWGMVQARLAEGVARAEEQKAVAERVEKEKALAAETLAKQAEADAAGRLQSSLAAEQQATYDMTIPAVQKAMEDCDQPRAAELLASCRPELRGWEWGYLNRQFDRNAITLRPSFGPGRIGFDAAYPTPDGRELLVLTAHPLGLHAQRWETATGKKAADNELLLPATKGFRWYAVSPDRRLVAVWEPPSNFVRRRGEQVDPRVPKTVPASARSVRVYDLRTAALVGELRGHTNWIYHVIFTNDSKQVVTGSSDRTIRFWDTDGRPGVVLNGHTKAVALPLAFTPDGRTLLAAGRDFKLATTRGASRTIGKNTPAEQATTERDEWFAWDLDTQTPRTKGELAALPLENFVGFDPNVSVSADGHYAILPDWVVSAVVDLTTGQRAVPLGWHTEPLGFTARGTRVLLLGGAGIVTTVDLAARRPDATFRLSIPTGDVLENLIMGNGTHAWDWNLSRDGRVLALGRDGERKTVIVNADTGREVGFVADKRTALIPGNKPFVGGRNHERTIAENGSFFTSSDRYGEIKLWKLDPVRPAFDVERFRQFVRDRAEGKELPGTALRGSAVSPDGRLVAKRVVFRADAAAERAAQVRVEVHDRATGALVAAGPRYDAPSIDYLRFDRDGRRVAGFVVTYVYGGPGGQMVTAGEYTPTAWDAATGKELAKGKPFVAPHGSGSPNTPQLVVSDAGAVLVASFVPDDPKVPAALQKGHWQIEDLGSGRPPVAFPPASDRVFQFGPGAKLGAFFEHGPGGKAIELWDLQRRTVVWTIPGADNPHQQTHGVFSPDGTRLFTFDGQNLGHADASETRRAVSVTVWDVTGPTKVGSFAPPAEALTTWPRPVGRDGSRLLCGDTVWNATTGRALVRVSDDRLSSGPRSQFRRGLDPDFVTDLLAEPAGRPDVWKPERTVGQMLAEARSRLMATSNRYDPAKALDLTTTVAQAYPSDPNVIAVHGEALLRAGRPAEAIPVLERALRTHDGSSGPVGGHAICFHLALACHATGREQDAKARLTEGVGRHVMQITLEESSRIQRGEEPDATPVGTPHASMSEAARALGVPVPSLDPAAITRDSDVLLRESLILRAQTLATSGRTDEALRMAEEAVANEPLSTHLAYNAACVFALAVPKAKADPAAQARHADRAIALLKRAVALGWDNVDHMKQDTDLNPLRGRDDFRTLLADLEKADPPRP